MVSSRWAAALLFVLLGSVAAQDDHDDHDHGDGGGTESDFLPTVSVLVDGETVRITLASGTPARWFGVAFGATLMGDEPYAIIVDGCCGEQEVEEVTLSAHAVTNRHGGSGLTVVSGTSEGDTYTTVIERPASGGHAGTVFTDSTEIQILKALGNSDILGYHTTRGTGTIQVQSATTDPTPTPSPSPTPDADDDDHGDHDGHGHGDHGAAASATSATSSDSLSVGDRKYWAIGLGLAVAGLQRFVI